MYYSRVLYWDEEVSREPKLVHPDADNSPIDNLFHNCIVLAHNEEYDILEEMKTTFKKNEDPVSKFGVTCINFVTNEMAGFCNSEKIKIYEYPILKVYLIELLMEITYNDFPLSLAMSDVIPKMVDNFEEGPKDIIERLGLNKGGDIDSLIEESLNKYPDKVKAYKEGNKNLFGMFMGEIIRNNKGINPKKVSKVLREKLDS